MNVTVVRTLKTLTDHHRASYDAAIPHLITNRAVPNVQKAVEDGKAFFPYWLRPITRIGIIIRPFSIWLRAPLGQFGNQERCSVEHPFAREWGHP
jgi:hypothetical protein